jgi:hypothetical protein
MRTCEITGYGEALAEFPRSSSKISNNPGLGCPNTLTGYMPCLPNTLIKEGGIQIKTGTKRACTIEGSLLSCGAVSRDAVLSTQQSQREGRNTVRDPFPRLR